MNAVSVLGMLSLLGIAWAISYSRRQVRLRPILWGIGLQVMLALIIIRQDTWSFVGMIALGLLIVSYIVSGGDTSRQRWRYLATSLPLAFTAGGLAYLFLPAVVTGWIWVAVVATLTLSSRIQLFSAGRKHLAALVVVLGCAWLVSRQIYGHTLFEFLSTKITAFLSLSDYGAKFLFGNLAEPQHYGPRLSTGWPGFGFQFAFKVLPTIVFFAALTGVLYYLGIMKTIIEAIGRFMHWTIGTSGAETLCCSGNIFLGHTEAPLLIRPFLKSMTTSELFTVMVGGFATVAGSGIAAYAAMGIPAGHLVAAAVMSAPAALVIGKIIYPERGPSRGNEKVELVDLEFGENVIEAAANGISDGLKLAVNIAAMLLGFISLIAVVDVCLNFVDGVVDGTLLQGARLPYAVAGMSPVSAEFGGIFPGSLQTLFGTILRPLAWLMGVPWSDAAVVGNLLGIKLSINEFVSYGTLASYIDEGALSARAVIISTYALCGFANVASIGIQIGGLSVLAPNRKSDLARIGLKAMIGGALASWLTATIAGILL
jgi:CNT family concentrative nucleoside transporter